MMQPAGGMVPPPMAPPPPTMEHQHQHQQWGMMPPPPPPQYQTMQAPPPQAPHMWGQPPPSQVPPPSHMMPPQPQFQPPPQFHPQPMPHYGAPPPMASHTDEIRTLWIGDLHNWMDEDYVYGCFSHTGEISSVKVIRNKLNGVSEGYGFIEFKTRAAAEQVLQTFNGQMMPNIEQTYRLNWAAAGEKRADDGQEHTLFVGDLAPDVTDYLLQETFRVHYASVKGAKIVTDRMSGRSKGYGFVRFGDLSDQTRAMTEMQGVMCSTRAMRVGPAASKKAMAVQQPTKASYQNSQATTESDNDPNNTTIFVGALDPNITEDFLRQIFSKHGEVTHVKIPLGKRCGFVQYASRSNAEDALATLHGMQLGSQKIRLSWGRSPANKQQSPVDPNQWNNNYYNYGQAYNTYGYAPPAQDPNMYAYGAYPGYGNYQQK